MNTLFHEKIEVIVCPPKNSYSGFAKNEIEELKVAFDELYINKVNWIDLIFILFNSIYKRILLMIPLQASLMDSPQLKTKLKLKPNLMIQNARLLYIRLVLLISIKKIQV